MYNVSYAIHDDVVMLNVNEKKEINGSNKQSDAIGIVVIVMLCYMTDKHMYTMI